MSLNIADLFEHAVDAAPDNPALKVGERTVTFAELETESNKLAHYLQSRGVKPGEHVFVTTEIAAPFAFKTLLDDMTWQTGPNVGGVAGAAQVVMPVF